MAIPKNAFAWTGLGSMPEYVSLNWIDGKLTLDCRGGGSYSRVELSADVAREFGAALTQAADAPPPSL